MKEQIERLEKINLFIKYIGELDKNRYQPILHSRNKFREFEQGYFKFHPVDSLLYFVDSYTKVPIRPTESASVKRDNFFSGGGNLWSLVTSFAEFIMTGQPGELQDYKEVWAFDYETTMKVREKAKEIGFIQSVDYPYELYPKSSKELRQ